MKRTFFALAVMTGLTLSVIISPVHAQPVPSYGPQSLAPLVERLLPAVVNISSTQKIEETAGETMPEMPHFPPGSPFEDFFEEFMNRHGGEFPSAPPASLGSGFVIDSEKGYIVTNAHVIQDADEVRVTLHDDTTMPAEVIGRDEKTDLALLKVDTKHPLVAVGFGDSAPLRVGDWVLAIGNPFGLGGSVTTGIVSAQQRDINAGPYDDFIQTDASINRGNSGGPMFNMNGEVIGINTAIYSPSGGSVGIGFAIPSNLAKPVIDQLIKYGKTRRGWMGVRVQTVTEDIAESLGMTEKDGALVASITPTSPAEQAGLKPGDVILEFDGKPVNQMRTLPRVVAETEIGKTVDVIYWRDGKKTSTKITVAELEKAEENGLISTGLDGDTMEETPSGLDIDVVGMKIRNLTMEDRTTYSIPMDVNGVIVTDLTPGAEASEKGILVGDVLVEINQQPVENAEMALEIINSAKKAGRSSVLILASRSGDVRFVALRLKPSETSKSNKPDKKTDKNIQ